MPFTLPVEAYESSQGGHAVPTGALPGGQAFPVSEWRLDKEATLVETTTSASGGKVRTTVLRGGSWTINVPWNSLLTPEAAGFREGGELAALGLILGSSGLMYEFPAIMEKVSPISNATNDVVRLTISGYSQGPIPDPIPVPA